MEASSVTRRLVATSLAAPRLRRHRPGHLAGAPRLRRLSDDLAPGRPGEVPAAARLRPDLGGGHAADRLYAGCPGQGLHHGVGAAGGDLAAAGLRDGGADTA